MNKTTPGKFKTVDRYISTFPSEVQKILEKIRKIIKSVAPKATETIGYGIPTFKLNGNLVHFAAYKTHIGFYPGPQAIKSFEKKLAVYETSKGTIKFPLNKSIPFDLIKEITEFRVNESEGQLAPYRLRAKRE